MTQSGIDDRFRRRANLFTFLFDVQARRTAHSDTRDGCVCACQPAATRGTRRRRFMVDFIPGIRILARETLFVIYWPARANPDGLTNDS